MLPRDMDPRRVLDFARHVDRLGFDELWVVEDLGFRGGIAQAAAVLAVTQRIRVGVGILPAAVRNVAFEAMEAATLAQLFPSRVDIGIGHGMPDWMRSVGVWPDRPLAYLGAHVTQLKALLRGERVSIGTQEDVADVLLDPAVVPATPPDVLLGVRGPKSLALSGRVADGTVLAEPCTPEYVRAAVARIDARTPHRVVAYNVAAVAAEEGDALRAARPGLQWIGEPDWAPHIAPLDIAGEFAALRSRCASPAEFAERMPDEWVARLALAGTPSQVSERIAELGRAGVTSAVLIPAGPDPFSAADSLAAVL